MRTTPDRKLPKTSRVSKYLVPHMKDKAGQLMVKPNIQRKDSVQTIGKKAENLNYRCCIDGG